MPHQRNERSRLRAAIGLSLLALLVSDAAHAASQSQTFNRQKCVPPPAKSYRNTHLVPTHQQYQGHPELIPKNTHHKKFANCAPPLQESTSATHTFPSTVALLLSFDGGATFTPFSAPALCTVVVTFTGIVAGVETYTNEMIQLDMMGGALPPGVRVRESPTIASNGSMTIEPVTGGFLISSIFDIFTEVSLDNGVNWSPSFLPGSMELVDTNVDLVFDADKAKLEWSETDPVETYDVASRLVSTNPTLNAWTGTGGVFDTMSCRTTGMACVDSDGDDRCEFNTSGLDVPTSGAFAIWLVREHGLSWDGGGEKNAAGDRYSRDFDMMNGTPICP